MIKTAYQHDSRPKNVHLGGWKKQPTDLRDEEYRIKLHPAFLATAVPPSGDLRSICSAIEDQGDLGSCTANAFAGIIEANERRGATQKLLTSSPLVAVSGITTAADGSVSFMTKVSPGSAPSPTPAPPKPTPSPTPAPATFIDCSRLFHYYATRKIEGTTSEDSGATIRDTAKAGATYGVLDEKLWPYDTKQFATNPTSALWTQAATHKVTSYHSIADGDILTMKATLAQGYLIEFGFNVYSYFMSQGMATGGILDVPAAGESLEGGHAVDLVGWNDTMKTPKGATGAFLVRNSWGTDWGQNGYFWMSYDYVKSTRLCSDFWVILSSPLSA